MGSITFLGTAPGVPVGDRFNSSTLLESGGKRFLLDAGEPCGHLLKARGVGFGTLDAILISHGHSDHVAGLPMVLQGAWLEERQKSLPVYLPGELVEPLRRWLEAVYLPAGILGYDLQLLPWEANDCVSLGDLRVQVARTSHLNGLRSHIDPTALNRFKAYSFNLEIEGKRLVVSADLGYPEDLDPHFEKPADIVICELSHFGPIELFHYLADREFSRLYLTHISEEYWAKKDEILAQARAMLPSDREVAVATDGLTVAF